MQIGNTVKITLAFIALITGLGMIGWAWWFSGEEMARQEQERISAELRRQVDDLQHRRDLLENQIATLINAEEQSNRAAVLRAESDLRDIFKAYADRTPQFAEVVTQLSNRLKIAYLAIKDKLSGTTEVQQFTAELFSQYVVTDQQSMNALNGIIAQFRSDLAANRNAMFSQAVMRIRDADLGISELRVSPEALMARLSADEQSSLTGKVSTSAWIGLLAIGGSTIAAMGAEQLVAQVVRIASGSMVGGALTGGQAGTAVSPGVGTAIGLVVGVVVGFGIDHWTNKEMAIRIEMEARQRILAMREQIWRHPSGGLKVKFDRLVKLSRETHEQVLRRTVLEERS